jgi:uncharacterized protein DUF3300
MASATAWTQAFGDACLAQRDQVMKAVQCLRQKAQQAESLRSDAQPTVRRGPSVGILPVDTVLYLRAELQPLLNLLAADTRGLSPSSEVVDRV